MKKTILMMTKLAAMTSAAYGQNGVVNGAAGGAVTGAIVGGPVGAAVGGVAGAIVGGAIDPPPREVVTYVQEQPAPQTRVIVQEPVAVGRVLPSDVVVQPVPQNPSYGYVVVGQQRVIVEPQSRKIVQVID